MSAATALLIGLAVGALCGAVIGWVAHIAKVATDPHTEEIALTDERRHP